MSLCLWSGADWMSSSLEWRQYFESNAKSLLKIPWDLGPELNLDEVLAIQRSLCEFQAGENSEGRHLIHHARRYALDSGDHEYAAAIRLFIAEEQRHARELGRFLTLNGIPLVRTTFNDRVFRGLRNLFSGLEMSLAVLITAELIAEVYYAALREATGSAILRRLCDQILRDELQHVDFQAQQLSKLRAGRNRIGMLCTMAAQRFLFSGTVVVVWRSTIECFAVAV